MQLSLQWLNAHLSEPLAARDLADRLTMAGLEVDAIQPAAAVFSGVVVGEILSCEPHPEADRLSVCRVSDGQETFQVVCGAANAAAGLKVPFAKLSAVLPGDVRIREAKLRGVVSQGMLCGASELGFEEDVDGLWVLPADAPVGQDLREYLFLDDSLLELDLTPNRGDCLGVLGVAREVAALTQQELRWPEPEPVPAHIEDQPDVAVLDPEACPRYAARIVRGVNARAPIPLWMRERLRRGGIRSINAVVDITNYVLLELGQPMHAFDLSRLSGTAIRIRRAVAGETLSLLDGSEKILQADTLVIADAERPQALAGIMGGAASGVTADTQDVLLESAFFSPLALAGKARQYGLHTDSSHRFERGVDPEGQRRALERATELLLSIAGGQPGPVVDLREQESAKAPIPLKSARVRRLLGLELPDAQIGSWLEALGCRLQAHADGWEVWPPSWRFDLNREVDLIEELARLYGYQNLPTSLPRYPFGMQAMPEPCVDADVVRDCLVQRGYREAITYSFVDPEAQQRLLGRETVVTISNPIASDMAAMRLSLWPGLLNAWASNRQRQQQRVRLFETGLVFQGIEVEQQTAMVAGLVSGSARPAHWSGKSRSVDFFDVRADVEALLALGGQRDGWVFVAAEHPALHPGQSARIDCQGRSVGWLGALHPDQQARWDVAGSVYLFELSLLALAEGKLPVFKGLSRFPEVRRDIALVLDRAVTAGEVADALRRWSGELLKELTVFDVFEDQGLGENRRSLGFSLVFQHATRTLVDDEIHAIMARLTTESAARWGAVIRNG